MVKVNLLDQIDQLKRGDRLLILPLAHQEPVVDPANIETAKEQYRRHLAEHGVCGQFAGRRDETVYVKLANGETVEHELGEILAIHRT